MHQRARREPVAAVVLLDAQRAVEIARHQHGVGADVVDVFPGLPGCESGDRHRCHRRHIQCIAALLRDRAAVRRAPGEQRRERAADDHRQRQLDMDAEDMRRDQADEQAARGTANRDHEVEARQVARRGAHRRELAVAEHASGEEARAVERDRIADVPHPEVVVERVGHAGEEREEQRQAPQARVPAAAAAAAADVEDQDEGEQVDHERRQPQERNRRDVLRDVARHREQHQRA